jgi:hypothetical protein
VLAWLGKYETSENTQFVYKSWLDAAAKLEKSECANKIGKVEPHLLAWLGKYETSAVARFVYNSWLDAAAKLDKSESAVKIGKVEPHLLAWLDKHETSENAGFFYRPWLDAAAKIDKKECAAKIAVVEPHVLAWLDKYETSEVARFVYKPWLDAAAKLDKTECAAKVAEVEPHVVAWLNANPGHQQSDFIIHAWLETTRNFTAVRAFALSWFKGNTKNPDAVFVLKYICREQGLPLDTIEDVISWCSNFPDNFDSICRIAPILSHYSTGVLQRPLIESSLLVLEHIQFDWLTDEGVRNATLATIGTLAWKTRFFHDIEPRLDAIHANFFRKSTVYSAKHASSAPIFALNPSLAQHVAGMLERKFIDPAADLIALERFMDWLAAWPVDRKTIARPNAPSARTELFDPGIMESSSNR